MTYIVNNVVQEDELDKSSVYDWEILIILCYKMQKNIVILVIKLLTLFNFFKILILQLFQVNLVLYLNKFWEMTILKRVLF